MRTVAMVVRLASCAVLLVACSAPSGPAASYPLPEQTTSAALPEPVGSGPSTVPRRLLWQGMTGAHPEIHGGVIVGGIPGAVQEVDARTGQLRWRVRYGPDEPLVESFVVGAGTVVLAVARDRSKPPTASLTLPEALLAVDLRTGRRLWSRRIPPLASQTSAATIVGSNLVLAGLSGQLTALDARSGTPRWTVGQGPRSSACPSQSFGDVQLSSPGPMLLVARQCPQAGSLVQRLDPTTGQLQWTFQLDKHHVGGTPTAGVNVQAQGDGTIFAVADTFDPGRDFDVDLLHALLPAAPNTGNVGAAASCWPSTQQPGTCAGPPQALVSTSAPAPAPSAASTPRPTSAATAAPHTSPSNHRTSRYRNGSAPTARRRSPRQARWSSSSPPVLTPPWRPSTPTPARRSAGRRCRSAAPRRRTPPTTPRLSLPAPVSSSSDVETSNPSTRSPTQTPHLDGPGRTGWAAQGSEAGPLACRPRGTRLWTLAARRKAPLLTEGHLSAPAFVLAREGLRGARGLRPSPGLPRTGP